MGNLILVVFYTDVKPLTLYTLSVVSSHQRTCKNPCILQPIGLAASELTHAMHLLLLYACSNLTFWMVRCAEVFDCVL